MLQITNNVVGQLQNYMVTLLCTRWLQFNTSIVLIF